MTVSDTAGVVRCVAHGRELCQSEPCAWDLMAEIEHAPRTTFFHHHEELLMSRIRKCSVMLAMTLGAVLLLAGVAGAAPTQIDTSNVSSDSYTDTETPPSATATDAGLDRFLLYYDGQTEPAGSEWLLDTALDTATDIAESNYLTESGTDATYEQGTGGMSSDGNTIAWTNTANNGPGLHVATYNNGTWTNEPLPGDQFYGVVGPLVTEIALSANGNLMAITGLQQETGTTTYEAAGVYLYNFAKGTVQQVTTQVQSGVVPVSLAFSSDGSRLLIAQGGACSADGSQYVSANGTVVVDSISSSDQVSPLWSSTSGNYGYTGCGGAGLSGDGNTVAFSGTGTGPAVVIGDLANSAERLVDATVPGAPRGFMLSQDGSIVAYDAPADDASDSFTAVYSSSTASGSVGTEVSDPDDLENCFLVGLASSGLESAFDCYSDFEYDYEDEGVFVAGGGIASGGGSGGPVFPSGAALQTSSVTTSGLTLSWPAATGPDGIAGYTLTENGNAIAPPAANATSIKVTGLAPGTSYHFRLTAGDSDGNVSAPLSVDVTTASPPVTLPSNLTPAPVKITPAPVNIGALAGAAASLSTATVSAYLAKIGVSCNGATDTSCDLAIKLILTETLKGGKVVAITARSKQKTTKRTVTLGTTTVTVAGGSHETVSVKLNGAARKLLRHYHHLKVALTATESTSNTVLVRRVLTFKQPANG